MHLCDPLTLVVQAGTEEREHGYVLAQMGQRDDGENGSGRASVIIHRDLVDRDWVIHYGILRKGRREGGTREERRGRGKEGEGTGGEVENIGDHKC